MGTIITAVSAIRLGECSRSTGEPMYAQAGIVGIEPGTYSRIIRGIQLPSEEQARKISIYFCEDFSFLWPQIFTGEQAGAELLLKEEE